MGSPLGRTLANIFVRYYKEKFFSQMQKPPAYFRYVDNKFVIFHHEVKAVPLRVTLTHFTLFSYERALRLPTSFPISGLARLGVKPRLCRSSWRALASTHPLMLPSTCSREALLLCPPWNLPSYTVESTLSPPCSRSDPLSLSPRCSSRPS